MQSIKRGYQLKQLVLSSHEREGGTWEDQKIECLTHISRSTTGCGHDAARPLNFWQSKVTDHNLRVFIHTVIQQILRLQRQEERSKRKVRKKREKKEKQANCKTGWAFISLSFAELRYLQVSVDYPHIMEVFDCIQDLMDELAGISLCVETFLHNSVKKLTSRHPVSKTKSGERVSTVLQILEVIFLFNMSLNLFKLKKIYYLILLWLLLSFPTVYWILANCPNYVRLLHPASDFMSLNIWNDIY